MPRIRFIRGVVFNGQDKGPGDEADVTEREAMQMVDGYKDAVRLDGEAPKPTGNTVRDQLQMQEPAVAHRDPVVKPAQRNR